MEEWREEAKHKIKIMPPEAKAVRERAIEDLYYFAKLMNPGYCYGSVHREIFAWMQEYTLFGTGNGEGSNKLIMLPRAHLKSHMVAVWVAWIVTRHPEVTIIYLSATSTLAETQLFAISNILSSKTYARYFPEYINPQVGLRERWSKTGLSLDHEKRNSEAVRDSTITTAGLTTNTTGWHADIIVYDDLVVPENAYTEDGREGVKKKSSQFTSIRNPGGFTMACGTRYHPNDIYKTWDEQFFEDYAEDGTHLGKKKIWEIREEKVETDEVFLWPRTIREDGKAYGFNKRELARIEGEYEDRTQFFAQYYNNPNESSSDKVSREKFQYYDQRFLTKQGDGWFISVRGESRRLNVYAAVDFAFSLRKSADYTAIVVIGMDCDKNIYVLDIDRFKGDRIPTYYKHIVDLHSKWGFNKLRAEVTVAQTVIVNGIKDKVKAEGLRISIDEFRPSSKEGTKEQRIDAALEEPYDDLRVWHFEGGWTSILEEELVLARPPHDDIKDAMASAVDIAVPPARKRTASLDEYKSKTKFNKRFGGMNYK